MHIKKTVLIATLGFMILIVFIFQRTILKLDNLLLSIGFGAAVVVFAIIAGYFVKGESKKSDIPIDRKGWLILMIYIAYPVTAIIFAAIGMDSITGWMGSLGLVALGIYTIYNSKQRIAEGRIYSIFGYYDKKKNNTAFKIVIVTFIILGILQICFGIFVFIALLW